MVQVMVLAAASLWLGTPRVVDRIAGSLVAPYILLTLRMLRRLMAMSLTATVIGPRQYVDRLASEWTQQLLGLGGLRDHLDQLYRLCHFLATSMIVLGWVVTTLLPWLFFGLYSGI
jgi:hypothetical protein